MKIFGAAAPRLWPTFSNCPDTLCGEALDAVKACSCADPFDVQARHTRTRRAVLCSVESSRYSEPTVQMQSLPTMLCGRDLLAVAPTGSGKTAAFALPIVLLLQSHVSCGPRALILEPTKELAVQVCVVAN